MGGTEESEEKVIEETQEHKKRMDEKQIVDLDKIVIKKREKKNEEKDGDDQKVLGGFLYKSYRIEVLTYSFSCKETKQYNSKIG